MVCCVLRVRWLRSAPHMRRALCCMNPRASSSYSLANTHHLAVVTGLWVPRTLHPPLESSHQLLDPTRGLGRLGLATLLRCIVLHIVGLLALET
jgi:hypothetical protein